MSKIYTIIIVFKNTTQQTWLQQQNFNDKSSKHRGKLKCDNSIRTFVLRFSN